MKKLMVVLVVIGAPGCAMIRADRAMDVGVSCKQAAMHMYEIGCVNKIDVEHVSLRMSIARCADIVEAAKEIGGDCSMALDETVACWSRAKKCNSCAHAEQRTQFVCALLSGMKQPSGLTQ